MLKIVALGLARVGAAAWRDGDRIVTRSCVLGSRTDKPEENSSRFLKWLDSLFAEIRPEVVSVEDDTGRGAGSRTLRGYHTVAMLCARKAGASYSLDIGASRARKLALSNGGGSKAEAVAKACMVYRLGGELTDDEVDAVIPLPRDRAAHQDGPDARRRAPRGQAHRGASSASPGRPQVRIIIGMPVCQLSPKLKPRFAPGAAAGWVPPSGHSRTGGFGSCRTRCGLGTAAVRSGSRTSIGLSW